MTAGLNIRVNIYRISYGTDDTVGGAQPTGTVYHQNVQARIEQKRPEQLLLQQGLETLKTFTLTCFPGTLDVRERDELEIISPSNHIYKDSRFRVIGVQPSFLTDPRGFLTLHLTRSERAHVSQ